MFDALQCGFQVLGAIVLVSIAVPFILPVGGDVETSICYTDRQTDSEWLEAQGLPSRIALVCGLLLCSPAYC
jgi:hypothetical protein